MRRLWRARLEFVAAAGAQERSRRWLVTLAAAYALLGALTGLRQIRGSWARPGLFHPPDVLVAPPALTYAGMGVLLVGLLAHAVLEWLPPRDPFPRHRLLTVPMVWADVLFALTFFTADAGRLYWCSAMLVCLFWPLFTAFRLLEASPPRSRRERALVDVPLGFGLGLTALAAMTGVASFVEVAGAHSLTAQWAAAVVTIIVLMVAGMILAATLHGRWAVMLGMLWGLAGIFVGRLFGSPRDVLVATTAFVAAGVVVAATVAIQGRRRVRRRDERETPS